MVTAISYTATEEMVVFGTTGDDTINMSSFNELVYGRGGSDTFVYKSWSDEGDSSSDDTIKDFTIGIGAEADQLDLRDLLDYSSGDTLSDFLSVTDGGAGGDVTIDVDINGDGSGTDLTITLEGIGTGTLDLVALSDNIMPI